MRLSTDHGNATVEFILIAPFFVFILMSFFHLYQKGIGQQKKVISDRVRTKQDLLHEQNNRPILERPCAVDPVICDGRKK